MQKIFDFIKYNNATVIILAIVLILGGGALAAGPENIGQKQTSLEGLDNTALLAIDLDTFNMDFKIENIQADDQYYYVTYSYLDLVVLDSAWQYQLSQKTQKVSKKIKEDVGIYMAKFMAKHYEARMRELKQEKSLAQSAGAQKRVEVTEYSGLIGRTLDLASVIFPGYEPVVKNELPSPENFNLPETANSGTATASGGTDNLTQIYNDYIAAHPEIFETPTPAEPTDTADSSDVPEEVIDTAILETPADEEVPGIPEPTSVDIIYLPAQAGLPTLTPEAPAEMPAEPEPAPAPAPTENTAPAE
ncbi:MAG: hypothetical protein V1801_03245 [Candidatus Falkowbacteria bacterium]